MEGRRWRRRFPSLKSARGEKEILWPETLRLDCVYIYIYMRGERRLCACVRYIGYLFFSDDGYYGIWGAEAAAAQTMS